MRTRFKPESIDRRLASLPLGPIVEQSTNEFLMKLVRKAGGMRRGPLEKAHAQE
jgi:hypothetical protein